MATFGSYKARKAKMQENAFPDTASFERAAKRKLKQLQKDYPELDFMMDKHGSIVSNVTGEVLAIAETRTISKNIPLKPLK